MRVTNILIVLLIKIIYLHLYHFLLPWLSFHTYIYSPNKSSTRGGGDLHNLFSFPPPYLMRDIFSNLSILLKIKNEKNNNFGKVSFEQPGWGCQKLNMFLPSANMLRQWVVTNIESLLQEIQKLIRCWVLFMKYFHSPTPE